MINQIMKLNGGSNANIQHNMERSSKLRKLENARRKLPFASVSACSAWIQEIRKDPSLLEVPAHPKHFREARDDVVLKSMTSFGPMLQTVKMVKLDDTEMNLFVAHPWALLDFMISHSDRIKALVLKQLARAPCTMEQPWHIILYSDEVTPGNVHAPSNNRKFQAVYWSFLELGPAALSHEEYWFVMMTEFSSNVRECAGGMSQVFTSLIKLFFEPNGFNAAPSAGGIYLTSLGIRLFVVMGVVLQDGGAHKSVWHSRDGSKMCMLCKNLFTIKSALCDADGTELLTCGVTKLAELVPETSKSLRDKARYLEYHRRDPNFDDLQQALGITYHPHMLLLDRYLDAYVDVVDTFMHDYMHALWVDGIFNLVLYLLFEAFFQERRPIYKTFSEYVLSWAWPSKNKVKATDLAQIFGPDRMKSSRKARHIKCSASDCWNLIVPLTCFVQQVLMHFGTCEAECKVFLVLLEVMDLVTATSRCRVEPGILLAKIQMFLDLFVEAFGAEMTTPKFHWLLHLPDYLERMHDLFNDKLGVPGWLQHCFVLERKHKVGKRYAEPRQNTDRMRSGGLLSEVLCQNMSDVCGAPEFKLGLLDAKKPTKSTQAHIIRALELDGHTPIQVARRSWHNEFSHSNAGDFVVFTCAESAAMRAGTVQLHFEVAGIPASVIELYELVCRDNHYVIWKPSKDMEWIETTCIRDPVVFKTLPNGNVAFLLPVEMR